ncbi:M3 family metallopeptidase, partial [Candidatus Gracilibacteria bacterium]|nr:M3 family metallopeptidase [Candidatus Gracilibacteria bacterium]
DLSLKNKMAESSEQVFKLLKNIASKAKSKAQEDVAILQSYFDLNEIHSYDVAYYSSKYKKEKYALDDKEIKKYFPYEHCLTYLHNFVERFYDLELREISACVYDENVKIYEVYQQGQLISYYLLDAFYRKEKRGGAWAGCLRSREYMSSYKKVPIIVNVCNFQKSEHTTLLTLGDVETLFHEFGHALHEILSESLYSELSGFGVEWDFVELPSQLLENWVYERESIEKLGKHYETGESLPVSILDTLDSLRTYMSGYSTLRQCEFALLDMHLYSSDVPKSIADLDTYILDQVNAISLFPRGDQYKMYTSFGHIFGGGYAAGYYSYMWAEILEADVFAEIKKRGMFDPEVGQHFVKTILGQGTRKPATELFYDFMGREVSDEAFMERKGF